MLVSFALQGRVNDAFRCTATFPLTLCCRILTAWLLFCGQDIPQRCPDPLHLRRQGRIIVQAQPVEHEPLGAVTSTVQDRTNMPLKEPEETTIIG